MGPGSNQCPGLYYSIKPPKTIYIIDRLNTTFAKAGNDSLYMFNLALFYGMLRFLLAEVLVSVDEAENETKVQPMSRIIPFNKTTKEIMQFI